MRVTKKVKQAEAAATLRAHRLYPDFWLLTPALQKMKVHPAMCMKTRTSQKNVIGKMVICRVNAGSGRIPRAAWETAEELVAAGSPRHPSVETLGVMAT